MVTLLSNPHRLAPEGIKAMLALEDSIANGGLEPSLRDLVRLRASQINGCAYCIHMRTTHLREAGEPEMRLYMLNAWRESTLYTPRERAAFGWTEALTRLAETGAPDSDYAALKSAFSDPEQVQLTLLIGAINAWNRLQVGFRIAHPVDESCAAT